MESKKEKALQKTYQLFIDSFMDMEFPMDNIKLFVDENVYGFGTTIDEQIEGLKEYYLLVQRQRDQSEGAEINWDRQPIMLRYSPDEDAAFILDLFTVTLKLKGNDHSIPMRLSTLLHYDNGTWKIVHWHGSQAVDSENDTWHLEEWKKKNEALQQLVNEKTADLAVKNRELEIEAALERVRAQSMAMKKSEDLAELSRVLVQQVQALGVETWFCAFNIYDEDGQGSLEWGCNGRNTFPEYRTPREGVFLHYYEAGKLGESLHVNVIDENHCPAHYDYLCSLPGVGDQLLQMKSQGIPFPTSQIDHVAYFDYGYLLFITYDPVPESHDIFIRFAKAFEQTYTRFLDLQKAERQAREAQIEAALERVRARSMAMHKTSELGQVVTVLFEQFSLLELDFYQVWINIFQLEGGISNCWFSPVEGVIEHPYTSVVPLGPFEESSIKSWRDGKEFSYLSWKGKKEVDKIAKSISRMSPGSRFEEIQSIKQMDRLEVVDCNHQYGVVAMAKNNDITDEDRDILKRFTKVFEQAYTRFLDLQNAEAQAREAHIETALERIRTASITMQNSSDLAVVIQVVFKQLVELGFEAPACGLNLYDDQNGMNMWISGFGEEIYPESFYINYFDHPYYNHQLNAWKKGLSYDVLTFEGELKESYDQHTFSNPDFFDIPHEILDEFLIKNKVVSNAAYIKYGMLEIISENEISDDEANILCRIAKVFQQAYTRFIDIQKAEAQAKEAKIEASLEKVRSRSLAMQHSNELQDVVNVLFDQIRELDISMNSASIYIFTPGSKNWEQWVASAKTSYSTYFNLPYADYPVFKDLEEAKKSNKEYYVGHYDKTVKDQWFKYCFNHDYAKIPEERKKFFLAAENMRLLFALSKKTAVQIARYDGEEYNQGDIDILKRFAQAFEQAFTRFQDLEKAESQTREAEIQLALERVRAKTMAMHSSEELLGTVTLLFEQFKNVQRGNDLKDIDRCFLLTISSQSNDFDLWITGLGGSRSNEKFVIDAQEKTHGKPLLKAHKEKRPITVIELEPGKSTSWFDYLRAQNVEISSRLYSSHRYNTNAFFSRGFLGLTSNQPLSNQNLDLLQRFSAVFEQTYTRFLDLQRAEAQAREAQIEAALERVRSRAMAMQTSNELADLIITIFTELQKLDMALTRCLLWIFDYKNHSSQAWMANAENPDQADAFHVPYHKHPAYKSYLKGWQNRDQKWEYVLKGKTKERWDEMLVDEYFNALPKYVKEAMKEPIKVILSGSFNKYGIIQTASLSPLSDENQSILQRFSQLFEQNYARFLDLQKAETQALEAQIEAALERVRASTMAMQRSNDLMQVVEVLYSQFQSLEMTDELTDIEICIIDESSETISVWQTTQSLTGNQVNLQLPVTASPHLTKEFNIWKKTDPKKRINHYFYYKMTQEELNEFLKRLKKIAGWEHVVEAFRKSKIKQWVTCNSYFQYGMLTYQNVQKKNNEIDELLPRFAKLFEQTYTRFLDLQKAEAQAREAQIEAALERVRNRTLIMKDSRELNNSVAVFFQEFERLGFLPSTARSYFCHIDTDSDVAKVWMTYADGTVMDGSHETPLTKSPSMIEYYEAWKRGDPISERCYNGQALSEYLEFVSSLPHVKKDNDYQKLFRKPPRQIIMTDANFIQGNIGIMTFKPLNQEAKDTLVRFAKAFEFTYTRFLDLKKAESQAREAQIETSLERIRAQAMAMRVSGDLLDIVVTMRKEFVALGNEAHYFWHMRWLSDRYDKAMTSGDGARIGMVMKLPRHIHGDIDLVAKWEKTDEPSLIFPMDADTAVDYVDKMITLGDFERVDPNAPSLDDVRQIGGLTFIMARTSHGEIGYSLPGNVPNPPSEGVEILTRFAGAFDLAYRRFEDLLQAEAREKEAIKQASIDRVRAEIASMRSPKDLERITPLIWQELQALGVPFFRCGIFIIREDEQLVHAYLSTPTGKSLAALHIPFDQTDIGMIQASIDHWRDQSVYQEQWDQQHFLDNMKMFIKHGHIENPEQYQAGNNAPDNLVLHLVPFKQGMLYVGNSEALNEDHIALIKSLAAAFAVAYSRYEDFVQLEDAKKAIEKTLADLKATQNQLVHSEKMASLGELTAGIAHEIQNPLNFVNNFSDLNKELIEELQEAIAQNDIEEVKALLSDLSANEVKITHHGKRAEQIVKSMLQHSRSSSGEKTPTDINALADEYLRLAYHGLRAKDKTFNADFKVDLDPELPKINVVAQDIGRVLLNLINNAFQAVREVEKPEVLVSTRAVNGQVEITVTDNGRGIPDNIKDKIFQPFFTTKPTGEGTGLGLSMSYDIVTKGHGGAINMKSQKGKGTEFIISLPYHD